MVLVMPSVVGTASSGLLGARDGRAEHRRLVRRLQVLRGELADTLRRVVPRGELRDRSAEDALDDVALRRCWRGRGMMRSLLPTTDNNDNHGRCGRRQRCA